MSLVMVTPAPDESGVDTDNHPLQNVVREDTLPPPLLPSLSISESDNANEQFILNMGRQKSVDSTILFPPVYNNKNALPFGRMHSEPERPLPLVEFQTLEQQTSNNAPDVSISGNVPQLNFRSCPEIRPEIQVQPAHLLKDIQTERGKLCPFFLNLYLLCQTKSSPKHLFRNF